MTVGVKRQAPLKLDPETDELISRAAHFLGMTKKEFVAEAAKAFLMQRREKVRRGMIESMKLLSLHGPRRCSANSGWCSPKCRRCTGRRVHWRPSGTLLAPASCWPGRGTPQPSWAPGR